VKIVVAAYGSRGDVEPCAAAARELLRRGHDVRMAVPPDKLGFVESAGLTAVAYGRDTRSQLNAANDFVRTASNPIAALPEVLERLIGVWTEKTEVLAPLAEGADLLVAGINEEEIAANVAESQGIPVAGLHFFPRRIFSTGPLYSGMTRQVANAQRRALSLPESEEAARASLEIQAYDEMCLPGPAAGWVVPGRPFVGALTLGRPEEADDEVLSWIAAGTPPICFGFGSTPIASAADTVALIGSACAELGERALICGGPNDFGDLPCADHVLVVEAVNHAAVLPACRAVVHHGGAGTTAAGLRAGVPTLILWLWLDQPVWAAGAERLGAGWGRRLSDTTRESLVADLRALLAPRYAARAREVASQMSSSAESLTRTADLLEGLARSQQNS
jgi:UDP:flavonoid glycosyltransferase YjiC (YdhE family)